ncbi:hypothetical protein KBB05_01580 [Patescibacteria group bacterium]|nr:hypothetical protein [Patescibacteria group bacterium]
MSDSSQIKTVVESTTPVPQFTLTPVSDWADPSQYIFDATSTYDYDMLNSTDKLTFDR